MRNLKQKPLSGDEALAASLAGHPLMLSQHVSRVLPPFGRLPGNGSGEQGPERVARDSRHLSDDSLVAVWGGGLSQSRRWGGMWALLPQPWTFTQVLKVGFSPDLGIQWGVKASRCFMVKFGLPELICVCQS